MSRLALRPLLHTDDIMNRQPGPRTVSVVEVQGISLWSDTGADFIYPMISLESEHNVLVLTIVHATSQNSDVRTKVKHCIANATCCMQ